MTGTMAQIRLKYVTTDRDRHGNSRYYFRKRGMARKIRLPGQPGSDEFMAAYQAAFAGAPLPATETTPGRLAISVASTGSLRWLCDRYMMSPEFKQKLATPTQKRRASALNSICREALSSDRPIPIGDLPYNQITPRSIRRLRDRRADCANGANELLKSIKVLFKWAVNADYIEMDPAKDVPRIEIHSDGYHTWTLDEIRQFEAHHPVGTMPRLALALLLYTGQRRSDVVLFGKQHIKDGMIVFTQQKNKARKPVTLTLKILAPLAEIIDATPSKNLTLLVNDHGNPFTPSHFGNTFRKWCDAAGLPHCTAHGLRKAGATIAAERGATQKQLMAIFGWKTLQQVQRYTLSAEQATLAAGAMHYLDTSENETGMNVSHSQK